MQVNIDFVIFFVLAFGAVGTALLMITRRNPVISVLYLIVNFFFLAVLYLTLQAQFIAIIQILVYAGAIMVLFLFVIMLLNLGNEVQLREKLTVKKIFALGLCLVMGALLAFPLVSEIIQPAQIHAIRAKELGTVEAIGKILFTRMVFPFEVVSVLLLAAIVGAVVLAKKKFE